jgi:hypothetical protein
MFAPTVIVIIVTVIGSVEWTLAGPGLKVRDVT